MGLLPKPTVTVTFTNRTIVRVILIIVATLLALNFFHNIARPLVLIFVAFFLALALNPAVSWITHRLKSKSRARATGVAYVVVLTVLISFFSLVIPPLVRQTVEFIQDVPQSLRSVQNQDSSMGRLVRRYNLDEQVDGLSADLANRFKDVRQPVLSTAGRVGSTIISTITVLVLTFMMLVEGPFWLNRLWELQPASKREHRKKLALKMYRVVTGYVNGQLLIALIAAGFALVALLISSTVMNESVNAVALAGIIALTGLIPMIGNTIGASIVVLVCLFSSLPLAAVMAVFFLIYQQVENVTIQPYIQSKTNELTPLLVFVAALLGIGFGGLLGGLVAIPVAGCAKILIEDYLASRKVSD
jgi:predicted PurR-regulated permease PerM